MSFELPELPWARDALVPYISKLTIDFHYGKHHKKYVDDLNLLTKGTEYENMSLVDIIKRMNPSSGPIYNNASQVWNHTFQWNCFTPNGGGEPTGRIAEEIKKKWGSFTEFKAQFNLMSTTHFGSGYTWLVKDSKGDLSLFSGHDAHNPISDGYIPLLTCDLWEHAHYLDTQNDKVKFLENFWQVVNWDFVNKNL